MKTSARALLTLILLFPVLTNCSATAPNKPTAGQQVQQELCISPKSPEYEVIKECPPLLIRSCETSEPTGEEICTYTADKEAEQCFRESTQALLNNVVKLKFYAARLRATIDCLRGISEGGGK